MERDWLLTIFVSAGQSRKLGKRSEAVEAVSQGLLTADTRVMVRLPSGERLQRRAIELDHLTDLFPTAKPEDVAPEPIVELEREPESAPEPEIEPALEPGPKSECVAEPEPEPEPEPVPESETDPKPSPEPAQVVETDSLPIPAPISEIESEVEPVLQQQADEEPLPEPIPEPERVPEPEPAQEPATVMEPEQESGPAPSMVLAREVVAEPQPEPEEVEDSETQAVSEPDGIPATDVGVFPPADDDWDYQPPPAAKSRSLVVKAAVLGLLLALLAAGAFMWFRGNEEGGKRYLLSDVSGFEAPKPNAKSGDRLSYGQAVMVEPSEADGWLRVVDGSYQGLYLPGTLLSREAPPEIDRTASGMIAAQDGMELRIAPDETTEVVGSIPAGSSRFAQGIVHDRDGRAWFVFLIDEDSLPRAAFGQRDGAYLPEQATVVPIPTATSESPVPVESVPAQSTSSARMDSCAGIRRKLDRFMCQDPELRGSEAEFSSAYARAAARFGQAGQTLQPMSRFAARIEQCGSPQCAGARYREQTVLLESLQPAARAIPVPIVREAARNATPRGNPGSWIRSDDYPARAMKAGEEGTVRFNLTIGPDGAVTACQIVGTSGSSALDEATCRLVSRRARFNPAIDSAGTAIEGRYANTVRWRLPE